MWSIHLKTSVTVTKKQSTPINFQTHYAEDLLEKLSEEDWHTLSCGAGTKGERYSDWARIQLSCIQPEGYSRWFLFRRQFSKNKNRFVFSYYQAFAPQDTSLETLVWVAASSWRIEECFKFAKSHLGLADYEVLSWTGWHRHTALVLAAGAFLSVLRFQLEEFPDVIDHPLFSQSRKAGSLDAFRQERRLSSVSV